MRKLLLFFSFLLLVSTANAETINIVTNNNASAGQTIYFVTSITDPDTKCNYFLDVYTDETKQTSYLLNVPSDSISYQVPLQNISLISAKVARHAKNAAEEYMYYNSNLFSVSIPIIGQTTAQNESLEYETQTILLGRAILGLLITFMFLEGLERIPK